jgi:hypothetical protein
MKAIIIILAVLFLSCTGKQSKDYTITYKVYYQNNTTIKALNCYCHSIDTYSIEGSNWIAYRTGEGFFSSNNYIENTTSPIEIINIKENGAKGDN